jgi:long-chain acyl-CoA synthetase
VGTLDEDGYLKITDRKKDIIVTSGGKNITPQYIENKLKASVYINDAVVIGDRRNYLTCLIMIDEDNVVKYAQDHKIQFSTYKDLTQSPEIYELIKKRSIRSTKPWPGWKLCADSPSCRKNSMKRTAK